jgi:HPt (histidine-containing phosphotransfer) domain-containing protein
MPAEGGGDPVVYDPEPLRRLETSSPGISVAVLAVFHRDLRTFLATASTMLQDGEADTMRRSAHKLKGAAGTIGARELQACAMLLERACRETGLIPPQALEATIAAGDRFLLATTPH